MSRSIYTTAYSSASYIYIYTTWKTSRHQTRQPMDNKVVRTTTHGSETWSVHACMRPNAGDARDDAHRSHACNRSISSSHLSLTDRVYMHALCPLNKIGLLYNNTINTYDACMYVAPASSTQIHKPLRVVLGCVLLSSAAREPIDPT